MSLNDIDRKTIVGLQMEKANLFLQQADMMCDLQQWDESLKTDLVPSCTEWSNYGKRVTTTASFL